MLRSALQVFSSFSPGALSSLVIAIFCAHFEHRRTAVLVAVFVMGTSLLCLSPLLSAQSICAKERCFLATTAASLLPLLRHCHTLLLSFSLIHCFYLLSIGHLRLQSCKAERCDTNVIASEGCTLYGTSLDCLPLYHTCHIKFHSKMAPLFQLSVCFSVKKFAPSNLLVRLYHSFLSG